MSKAWTPGPWAVTHYRTDDGKTRARIVQVRKPLSRILIEPPNWFLDEDKDSAEFAEFEANMIVMAAASDLAEVVADFIREYADKGEGWDDPDIEQFVINKARLAIAKAGGE